MFATICRAVDRAALKVMMLRTATLPMNSTYQKHAFTIALVLIAAVNSILFIYFVEKASIRVPVVDLLDWLRLYAERSKDGDWLGYLWTPHNEHHMVFSRILLALDIRWFGNQGEAFAASGFVLLLGMAATICWKIMQSDLLISWKLTAIPIAVLLLTSANTAVMIGMQTMGGFLQASSFGVFALALLDGATEQDHFSKYRRTAAIVCACLAAFGDSGGLLIWPAVMWSAWKRWLTMGVDRRHRLRRNIVYCDVSLELTFSACLNVHGL
jgi:hypothetical protein